MPEGSVEGGIQVATYNLYAGLAIVLEIQRERSLQTGGRLLEDEECLVRTLALAAQLSREGDLESIGGTESDSLGQGGLGAQPVCEVDTNVSRYIL